MDTYDRTVAEISLDAVEHNFREIRRLAGKAELLAVLKADGYGHGALPIARLLAGRARYLGVAILEEAVELREGGIEDPILVLGYTDPRDFGTLLDYRVTPTVYTLPMARALSDCAVRRGERAALHIAVDTGMSRIGFPDSGEGAAAIRELAALPGLAPEGIFTHYAGADLRDKSSADCQTERFRSFLARLAAEGVTFGLRHICNSAGVMEFGAQGCELVRAGIVLYGLIPSDEVKVGSLSLRPAMRWVTRIAHLKTLPAGCGVSYGGAFVTERETAVATLPVGYADGYPRALSGKGRVLLHGRYAPILGRICMDQMMVDVTDIPGAAHGDEAVLLGADGENRITAEELGEGAGSFHYELVCGVSKRVPRVYFRDGKPAGRLRFRGEFEG